MRRTHQLRDVAAAHRVAAVLIIWADPFDRQKMRERDAVETVRHMPAVFGIRHVLRLRRRRQGDERHVLAQAAFPKPGYQSAHAEIIRHEHDRDAERRQRAGQEQRAQRAVGLARGGRSRRDEKASHHRERRPRVLGEAPARRGEIAGASID